MGYPAAYRRGALRPSGARPAAFAGSRAIPRTNDDFLNWMDRGSRLARRRASLQSLRWLGVTLDEALALGRAFFGRLTIAWTAWEAFNWYRDAWRLVTLPGWKFCRFCVPPFRLNIVGVGPYYRAGGGNCASLSLACNNAQSIAGVPQYDDGARAKSRYIYQVYDLGGGVLRADTIYTWTTTFPMVAHVPEDRRPAIPVLFPPFLFPKEAAAHTGVDASIAPPAIPYPVIPLVAGLPGSFQTREAGYREPGYPQLAPPIVIGLDLDGRRGTAHMDVSIGLGVTPRTYAGAGVGGAEQKQRLPPAARAAFAAMAAQSEVNDFLESLYKAIPFHYRAGYPNTQAGRIAAIAAHWRQIDWGAAVAYLALNEAQDKAYGSAYGRVQVAAHQVDPSGNLWRILQSGG